VSEEEAKRAETICSGWSVYEGWDFDTEKDCSRLGILRHRPPVDGRIAVVQEDEDYTGMVDSAQVVPRSSAPSKRLSSSVLEPDLAELVKQRLANKEAQP